VRHQILAVLEEIRMAAGGGRRTLRDNLQHGQMKSELCDGGFLGLAAS
jgi:hypothetical protein